LILAAPLTVKIHSEAFKSIELFPYPMRLAFRVFSAVHLTWHCHKSYTEIYAKQSEKKFLFLGYGVYWKYGNSQTVQTLAQVIMITRRIFSFQKQAKETLATFRHLKHVISCQHPCEPLGIEGGLRKMHVKNILKWNQIKEAIQGFAKDFFLLSMCWVDITQAASFTPLQNFENITESFLHSKNLCREYYDLTGKEKTGAWELLKKQYKEPVERILQLISTTDTLRHQSHNNCFGKHVFEYIRGKS
jgi:hypothetical protein